MPREKARKAEETGIYLRKRPIVPKMTMEATIIRTDFRSFFLLSSIIIPICFSDGFLFQLIIVERNSVGEQPLTFRNARLKEEMLEKPDSNAISVMRS